MINGSFYAGGSPIFGWICDKISQPKYVALFGAFSVALGYILMGPAPFVPYNEST